MDFYKSYGAYKDLRDASWQCLIDCGVKELPVNMGKIAAHYGIKIVHDSSVGMLDVLEHGRIIACGNAPIIIISDDDGEDVQRFTAAHELAHFLLGHLGSSVTSLSRSAVTQPQEREAEYFATRLIAPACVLWGLDVHTAEDICRICRTPISAAVKRAQRMEELYRRNKFLTSPVEKRLYSQFYDYIKNSHR